ncbi:hypothetical protein [Nocardia sp. CA-120079]|uniref:hypothetical protein n=1 Tax=Nocardia sp. CA-120079 TaxID=3239974 RepID=UPI003D966745
MITNKARGNGTCRLIAKVALIGAAMTVPMTAVAAPAMAMPTPGPGVVQTDCDFDFDLGFDTGKPWHGHGNPWKFHGNPWKGWGGCGWGNQWFFPPGWFFPQAGSAAANRTNPSAAR